MDTDLAMRTQRGDKGAYALLAGAVTAHPDLDVTEPTNVQLGGYSGP